MSKKTETFEIDCTKMLKHKYGNLAKFVHMGKSDSTVSDIHAQCKKNDFYIEVKECNSQCCQFVLFPNEETHNFDFSSGNKCPKSGNCDLIISYMNENYTTFSQVGKTGIPISVDKSILYGLVNDFHTFKNVRYFITQKNDYIIFPLERFSNYFDITAFYRKKPSGSSEPNKNKNNDEIVLGLQRESIVGSIEYKLIGGKTRCFIYTTQDLHKKRVMCDNYTYQFKRNEYSAQIEKIDTHAYEIRRLSNTSNPNVICQLSLIQSMQNIIDIDIFENELR